MERQWDSAMKREIAENLEKPSYFKSDGIVPEQEQEDGTREMGELYPFLISGGKNTERYYFIHINDKTEYKFNIKPKYFGDESSYTEVFPKRIQEILNTNNDAKIFCVFDWDTIFENETELNKYKAFEKAFETEILDGIVTLCPSMPSIEYWFLLHFEDTTRLLNGYGKVAGVLTHYIKPCFSNPKEKLKKLLKSKKYLEDATWVENLCANGKLELAMERAEKNIKAAVEAGKLYEQSYSYVYKVFKKV